MYLHDQRVFGEDGAIRDDARGMLQTFVDAFIAYIQKNR
jgi:hypothetical protein